jgi:UrcA family protein
MESQDMYRFATTALVAVALAMGAQQACAAPSDDGTVSVPVRYSDLDLQHAAGARSMLDRLNAAAQTACGPRPAIVELSRQSAYDACVKESVSRGVRTLNAPLVSAAFANESGASESITTAAR